MNSGRPPETASSLTGTGVGFHVPETVVRRRFDAGLRNFKTLYQGLVNSWVLYDNSGPTPRFLAAGENP